MGERKDRESPPGGVRSRTKERRGGVIQGSGSQELELVRGAL